MRRRTYLLALMLTTAMVLPAAGEQRGQRGIVVYEDADYRGHRESFTGPVRSLRDVGLNDRISSFEVPPGEAWEMCEDDDFRGRCQVFSGAVEDLSRTGWNDRISSLRPAGNNGGFGGLGGFGGYGGDNRDRRGDSDDRGGDGRRSGRYGGFGGQQRGRLELFEDKRFDGKSIALEQARQSLGSMDAKAESLRLSGTWEICDLPNFRGRCMIVTRDISDLEDVGWKERIRSARPR